MLGFVAEYSSGMSPANNIQRYCLCSTCTAARGLNTSCFQEIPSFATNHSRDFRFLAGTSSGSLREHASNKEDGVAVSAHPTS